MGAALMRRFVGKCVAVSLALAGTTVSASAHARAWEFHLKSPGTYKLQIEHRVADPGPRTKVTYEISIGSETRVRKLDLIANRPFIPLMVDVPGPREMRMKISGLPESTLKQTRVYVYDVDYVPYGEYFDPAKSSGLGVLDQVRKLLARAPDDIDLASAKLVIDKIVKPQINIEETLRHIDAIVARVRKMPEFGESAVSRAIALQRYIYNAGAWNDYEPFTYDLDDPLGSNINNKLLPTYLATKKGNCVTMPFLFIILGQRLGIDVTATTAPNHLLVKFRNESGVWINLEATSGANPARESWIRQQSPSITDEAIANGVYLQPLSKKETVAVMATVLAERYLQLQQYRKAIATADLVLEFYPKDVAMMTLKAVAYGRMARTHFVEKYPSPRQIPVSQRGYFEYLSRSYYIWFAKAEALGWREETREEKSEYLQQIKTAREQKSVN